MMQLIKPIDNLLNNITMYRLLTYGLALLLLIAAVFGFTDVLSFSGIDVLATTSVLVAVCYATNKILSRLYGAIVNNESHLITALILACILSPAASAQQLVYIGLAGMVAMASKFLLTYKHRHIFNPAAAGAAFLTVSGLLSVSWWIGNPSMFPFVIGFGLLVVRKMRHFKLVFMYVAAVLAMLLLQSIVKDQAVSLLIKNAVMSGPLVFFAAVMLTEPATMPSTKQYRLLFAALVGVLYAAQLRVGVLSTSPHMVLLAGNIFAFAINPKVKMQLKFKEKIQVSGNVADFVFTRPKKFNFIAGQYVDWTLPHAKVDGRGTRRTFTIASSPTEEDIHVGLKFYTPSSSFKNALSTFKKGDEISIGQLAGDFTLPRNVNKKLVFIAGGIGITPFRSMIKYLTDTKQKRDVVLLYCVGDAAELAYKEVFKAAQQYGVKTVAVVGKSALPADIQAVQGVLTADMIKTFVPDYKDRLFYISGPNGLVLASKEMLKSAGIAGKNIHTDYFSGY